MTKYTWSSHEKDDFCQYKLLSDYHNKNPKPTFVSKNLDKNKLQNLIELIREYMDIFAWNYEDMQGLDPNISHHHLSIKLDTKPMKQQQKFKPKMQEVIEAEVKKLSVGSFAKNNTMTG